MTRQRSSHSAAVPIGSASKWTPLGRQKCGSGSVMGCPTTKVCGLRSGKGRTFPRPPISNGMGKPKYFTASRCSFGVRKMLTKLSNSLQ